jgi:hypothetical protein
MTKGNAGFVVPLKQNIVYIEIEDGNRFGEFDFVMAAGAHGYSIEGMVEKINQVNFNLVR